jgi:two-component system sensor histidine kinase YcbA
VIEKGAFKNIMWIAVISAILGQFFVNPFNSDFRFTLAVISLSVFFILFENIPIVLTSLITGITVLTYRITVDMLINGSTIYIAFTKFYPSIVFYSFFGVFLFFFKIRDRYQGNKKLFVFILVFADFISNVSEIIARTEYNKLADYTVLLSLFSVAIFRGVFSYFILGYLENYKDKLVEKLDKLNYNFRHIATAWVYSLSYAITNNSRKKIELIGDLDELIDGINNLSIQDSNTNRLKSKALGVRNSLRAIKQSDDRIIHGSGRILSISNISKLTIKDLIDSGLDLQKFYSGLVNKKVEIYTLLENPNLLVKKGLQLSSILFDALSIIEDNSKNTAVVNVFQKLEGEKVSFTIISTDIIDSSNFNDINRVKLDHIKDQLITNFGSNLDVLLKGNDSITVNFLIELNKL